MRRIKLAVAVSSLFLALAAVDASAEQYQTNVNQDVYGRGYDNDYGHGYGRGRGNGYDRRRPYPRPPNYRLSWQYAGQISAPMNGAPGNWHNINYCGTEYPRECYNRGNTCYVNNGYWWDNVNNHNWFNYYECR